MAVMNSLDQHVCTHCVCMQFSPWKMNARVEEGIDLRPSST